ncbi:MarR family transcriptional regulator [Xylanimonas allomyrinae]|uniref:MarR family transcriptional regulator n=1 Tax=Xylanimonas allomyrinae TaxID=2509459 RepID=A0A4P6ES38_9MICO|nr:MarR family transcriptional regulator [Xylanimonas allomyrinae]QAY63207.1 MarR family transcriptional regulator [Xylanimonas allomyrinae]
MDRSETEAEIFGSLFVLGQHLTRHTEAALVPFGVTSRQWLLLAVLTRAFPGQRPTLSQTAAVFGTSRQNVKKIAGQVAARGLVELLPDPSDGRTVRLAVTDKVSAVFDTTEAVAQQRAFLGAVFADLTDCEVATLFGLVSRCIDTLQRTDATGEVPA